MAMEKFLPLEDSPTTTIPPAKGEVLIKEREISSFAVVLPPPQEAMRKRRLRLINVDIKFTKLIIQFYFAHQHHPYPIVIWRQKLT